ncbi:MAG: patatin-like phospholipase family protein [Patescibacteria group bacterium]|jgi:predicted patatin/cPLA2 family phospholipase
MSTEIHPVLQHLLARRGKTVPVQDGRKIALVLYGGAMAGIVGGGAVQALHELGLDQAFDHIFANSAGFCNASYFLANQVRLGITIYSENLTSKRFINLWRFWKMVDVDYAVEVMRNVKPLKVEHILASATKLHVSLYNQTTKKDAFLEVHDHPAHSYFDIVHAATAIHFFHPGATQIDSQRYMDTKIGQEINRLQYARALGCTDILIIYNRKENTPAKDLNQKDTFEIRPDRDWNISQFERNPTKLLAACRGMGHKVKVTFGLDKPITI